MTIMCASCPTPTIMVTLISRFRNPHRVNHGHSNPFRNLLIVGPTHHARSRPQQSHQKQHKPTKGHKRVHHTPLLSSSRYQKAIYRFIHTRPFLEPARQPSNISTTHELDLAGRNTSPCCQNLHIEKTNQSEKDNQSYTYNT